MVTLAGAGSRRLYLIAFATIPTMVSSPPWLFVGLAAIAIIMVELALRRGPEPIVPGEPLCVHDLTRREGANAFGQAVPTRP